MHKSQASNVRGNDWESPKTTPQFEVQPTLSADTQCTLTFISNYVPHIDGFLQVVLANLDSRCTASVKLAYSLIQQHQTTIPMQKEPCLGKGVLTGVLLSIFLVEFWRRSVYERSDTLPFPDNPGFIHRLFLDRAIKKRPDINDWIEKRKYLSTLPLSALLEDLSDVLKKL